MSTFNPSDFLNSTTTQANSTRAPLIPEHEASAYIKDIQLKTPKSSVILDVTWAVTSMEAREATGLNEPTVRQSIFLDITSDGHLDTAEGKNTQLGRLRKALGQNEAGKPWSPSMLVGMAARIHIVQRPDSKNPERIYNDVKSVGPAA